MRIAMLAVALAGLAGCGRSAYQPPLPPVSVAPAASAAQGGSARSRGSIAGTTLGRAEKCGIPSDRIVAARNRLFEKQPEADKDAYRLGLDLAYNDAKLDLTPTDAACAEAPRALATLSPEPPAETRRTTRARRASRAARGATPATPAPAEAEQP